MYKSTILSVNCMLNKIAAASPMHNGQLQPACIQVEAPSLLLDLHITWIKEYHLFSNLIFYPSPTLIWINTYNDLLKLKPFHEMKNSKNLCKRKLRQ
jgi:hypothetical protein